MWISLADVADNFLVFAWTDLEKKKQRDTSGISAFIVERGFKGFSSGTLKEKWGILAGNTGYFKMDDVEVPAANLVGREGEGFKIAMFALDQGRYTVAAGATGLIRACRDASAKYARERKTFGVEIGEHQLVKQMIAQMESDYQSARLLWLRAGWLKNIGRRNTRETGLAKWFATVASERAAGDAVQVHGANGYSDEYPVGRFYRNCKGAVIYEGHARDPHRHAGRLRARVPRRPPDAAGAAAVGSGLNRRRPEPGPATVTRALTLMETDLSLEFLRVVEQAAIACAHTMGQGDRPPADRAAVEAMRRELDRVPSTARSSSAKASATKRRCSTSARKSEPAGDRASAAFRRSTSPSTRSRAPTSAATGAPGAIAVLAASEKGGLLHAPDLYMEKLVVPPQLEARGRSRRAGRRQPARHRRSRSTARSRISSSSCSIVRGTSSSSPTSARRARASG